LAIKESRIRHVNLLLRTFRQYSDYDVVVYTDQHPKNIDAPANKVIQVTDITSAPFKVQAAFNFNLKGIVTSHAYKHFLEYDRIVWADCDVYLTDRCALLESYTENEVYFRIGKFPPPPSVAERKYQQIIEIMKVPDTSKDLVYPNEVLFVIRRCPNATQFINRWADLCVFSSLNHHINPCYEAIELSMALGFCKELDIGKIPIQHFIPGKGPATLFTEHRDKAFAYL